MSFRIIHLILGKANPERMNGVNKVVFALATQQARAGWDVGVWGVTPDPVVNYPPREFTTRLFRAAVNPFRLDPALIEAIEQAGPATVFHLHGGFVPLNYAAARQLRAGGIPYVFTPHGAYNVIAMQRSRLAKAAYTRLFERAMLRHAALLHCLGQSEVLGAARIAPGARHCLLPYGFELPAVPVAEPVRTTAFRIGFCGRLDAYTKGLDCVLAGFRAFVQRVPAAELWLIGDGSDRALVEQWAALAPAGAVRVLGSRFGAEKLDLLAQLDVFVHPSRNEGLPTAVLEAAALGVPCLISEATNLGTYVREHDCGLVIAATDPDHLAAGLDQLYQQCAAPERRQALRRNSRQLVTTAFDWSTLLGRYRRMYEQALLPEYA